MFTAEGTPIGNVYHCPRIFSGRTRCQVHRTSPLIFGILKKSEGKKESPKKKAKVLLESFAMDSFWKFLRMISSRRLKVILIG
jgi:hypothetical protein